MHGSRYAMPFIALSLLAGVVGCTVEDRTVVRERPADRVEVVPPQPSPAHVWVRGRWERRGSDWNWVEGRWERR